MEITVLPRARLARKHGEDWRGGPPPEKQQDE
jgi:hypothetical protein